VSGYDREKERAERLRKTDRLCENFEARELLGLLHPYQLKVLYKSASHLMDWGEDEEEEALTP